MHLFLKVGPGQPAEGVLQGRLTLDQLLLQQAPFPSQLLVLVDQLVKYQGPN